MRAAFYTGYGSPEKIILKEADMPLTGNHDLLVEVHATTVNRTDCAILKGSLLMRLFTGINKPKRPVPGTDFAGKVLQTGRLVTEFKPGDRVFGFDDMGLLSQAQYTTIKADKDVFKIPVSLQYNQAVALLEGVHYAVNFINKVSLHPRQKVLVNGATGAIGSALVQLSKYHGLEVTATCRKEHMDLVRTLGADKVIDYTREDFLKVNETYDYVFDSVGKSTFGECKNILKEGGIYISSELGPRAENPFLALTTKFFGSKKVIFPIPVDRKASIKLILNLYSKGAFKPVIDRTFPLYDIQEAYRYVASGQKVGNVILAVDHE